jgi:hypothetical protein
VNCCVVPNGIAAAEGDTTNETIAGGPTVSVVEADTVPSVAVIVAVPVPELVARPVAFITAIIAEEDVHCTMAVKSCVLPSV